MKLEHTLFSFKKSRGQKLPLSDIDGAGSLALLDVVSSSSSSSSDVDVPCSSELVLGLVHPGDGRNSAQSSLPCSETSSSSDCRRDRSVSIVRAIANVPQEVEGSRLGLVHPEDGRNSDDFA